MFAEVWKYFTVTTVLVVPILGVYAFFLHKVGLQSPILQVFLEHGLRNAYLGVRKGKKVVEPINGKYLYLVFFKERVQEPSINYVSDYYSLNELIIDWKLFESIYFVGDTYIVYKISIPEKWEPDIVQIVKGRYSQVSDDYKNGVNFRKVRVPESPHQLIKFLIARNIAVKTVTKDPKFKEKVEDYLDTTIPEEAELFKQFVISKELLDLNHLLT